MIKFSISLTYKPLKIPLYETVKTYDMSTVTKEHKLLGRTILRTEIERDGRSYVWYSKTSLFGRPIKYDVFQGFKALADEIDKLKSREAVTQRDMEEFCHKITRIPMKIVKEKTTFTRSSE